MVDASKPDDWCAATFVFGPNNTMVWVRDIQEYGGDALLKAPGGRRKKPGEQPARKPRSRTSTRQPEEGTFDRTPMETARFELDEETGLAPGTLYPLPQFTETRTRWGKRHTAYFYVAFVDSYTELLKYGNEGELVVVRSIDDEIWPNEMIQTHYPILQWLLQQARERVHSLELAAAAEAA